MDEIVLGVPPAVMKMLNDVRVALPFPLPLPGWYVFSSEGHYCEYPRNPKPLCGVRRSNRSAIRRWNVYQDVGRIPLCEGCKAKLRAA